MIPADSYMRRACKAGFRLGAFMPVVALSVIDSWQRSTAAERQRLVAVTLVRLLPADCVVCLRCQLCTLHSSRS